jgi:hypothetical protein
MICVTLEIGQQGSGVRIEDLLDSSSFKKRRFAKEPDRVSREIERLQRCIAQRPEQVFQELVQIAVDSCHADSAGISLEEENAQGELQFRWFAVAGSFAPYLNGTTPRFYSPCGTCLDRGVPQLYQVTDPYYNFLGVSAEPILDGILIPWRSGKMQGTIWLVSHHSDVAFDRSDYELMRALANIVSEAMNNPDSQELNRTSK